MERLVLFLVDPVVQAGHDEARIKGDTHMLRTVFAIGIAGLIFAGGSGTTQAAPTSRFLRLLPSASII